MTTVSQYPDIVAETIAAIHAIIQENNNGMAAYTMPGIHWTKNTNEAAQIASSRISFNIAKFILHLVEDYPELPKDTSTACAHLRAFLTPIIPVNLRTMVVPDVTPYAEDVQRMEQVITNNPRYDAPALMGDALAELKSAYAEIQQAAERTLLAEKRVRDILREMTVHDVLEPPPDLSIHAFAVAMIPKLLRNNVIIDPSKTISVKITKVTPYAMFANKYKDVILANL